MDFKRHHYPDSSLRSEMTNVKIENMGATCRETMY